MDNITEITSIQQYVDAIISAKEDDKQYYYRGEPRFYYKLLPSIARNTYILNEQQLINKAKQVYPHVFKKELSPLELLITLQHYKIPTRLLDITTNALVALFFACNNPIDENLEEHVQELDGKVYIFQDLRNSKYDGIENILSRTYQLPVESIYLDKYLEFIKSYPEYKDMQSILKLEIAENIGENINFEDFFKSEENRILNDEFNIISYNPLLINPPMLFDRVRIQAGNFMLFFNKINQEESEKKFLIENDIQELDENHRYIKKIIKVKDEAKEDMLENLKLFNISEGMLFYDNIDKNCEIIKRSICGE